MAVVVTTSNKRMVYIKVDHKDACYELKSAIDKLFGVETDFEGGRTIHMKMEMSNEYIDYSDSEIAAMVEKMIAEIADDKAREHKQDKISYEKHDPLVIPETEINPLADAIAAAARLRAERAIEYAEKGEYGQALGYRNDAEDLMDVHKWVVKCAWKRALSAYKVMDTIVRESIPYTVVRKIEMHAGVG
jgi:hypothetical protein